MTTMNFYDDVMNIRDDDEPALRVVQRLTELLDWIAAQFPARPDEISSDYDLGYRDGLRDVLRLLRDGPDDFSDRQCILCGQNLTPGGSCPDQRKHDEEQPT